MRFEPRVFLRYRLTGIAISYTAPELFDSWEDEGSPAKSLSSDCYALGHVIIEVQLSEVNSK